MKNKLNIAIDTDGVIYNLPEYLLEKGKKFILIKINLFFKKIVNKNFKIKEDEYAVSDMFGCGKLIEIIFWITHIYDYSYNSKLNENAIEIIKKWQNDGHEVSNVTARLCMNAPKFIIKIIENMLLSRYKKEGIEFDYIYYCSLKNSAYEKSNICKQQKFDLIVEDDPDNIKAISTSSNTKVLCFTTRYNKVCSGKNIIQVEGFLEADKVVSTIELLKNSNHKKKEVEMSMVREELDKLRLIKSYYENRGVTEKVKVYKKL